MTAGTAWRQRRWVAGGLAAVALAVAAAELPDADFLEYLGTWEEEESDWLALAVTEGLIDYETGTPTEAESPLSGPDRVPAEDPEATPEDDDHEG